MINFELANPKKNQAMLTQDKVTAIFCLVDDMLKGINYKEPSSRKMNDSEVITTAYVSALYFGGHMEHSMAFMKMTGMIPDMLSKSRFCRRLHKCKDLVLEMFAQLGRHLKAIAGADAYIIDTFPVASCQNVRISRSRLFKGESFRGYTRGMRQWFYGVKVEVLTTQSGIPVEFCFVPGGEHDHQALYKLPLDLCPESQVFADAAFTDYQVEDDLLDADQIQMMVQRKSNSKRKDPPWIYFIKDQMRKRIETTFSQIKALFLRNIHAVTAEGFLIKLMLFIMAFTLDQSIKN